MNREMLKVTALQKRIKIVNTRLLLIVNNKQINNINVLTMIILINSTHSSNSNLINLRERETTLVILSQKVVNGKHPIWRRPTYWTIRVTERK